MVSTPDYCPFCGARLRDDEQLESHLDDYPECRARFEEWRGGRSGVPSPEFSAARLGVLLLVVTLVMAYSVLVAGQILLGVLASIVVVLAFVVGSLP